MNTTISRGDTGTPTHQQDEPSHSGRHKYEPTLEEIAAECQAIRSEWSEEERLRRLGAHANDFGPGIRSRRVRGHAR